jgi:peptidoglycan/xylan/chitin deacetylase (PgdA/CDA1 family)
VPRLLDLLARHGARATFLFSLGPDSTGKAVKRVFRRGFVKKVMSASPAASYGLRTMLYGTLLPAPDVGTRKEAVARMREADAAGHECGIHAWDHVDWHDRLPGMGRAEVFATFGRAADRFAEIFGRPASVAGAPGWTASGFSVEAYEAHGIRVSSDTRGGPPFRPRRADGEPSGLVEVPSTLPTLDELLAWEEFRGGRREGAVERLRRAVECAPGVSVHSIHTEIEGGRAFAGLFARQLEAWAADGVRFVTLGEAAAEAAGAGALPARELGPTMVRGRALPVTTGLRAEPSTGGIP